MQLGDLADDQVLHLAIGEIAGDEGLALLDGQGGRGRAIDRVDRHAERASCDQAFVAGETRVLDDSCDGVARLAQLARDLLDHGDQAPRLGELGVRLLLLEQRDDGGRHFERAVAPASRFAAVQAHEQAGKARRRFDPAVADGGRARKGLVDHGSRLGELTQLQQDFAELGKQGQALRRVLGEQRDGTAQQIAGGVNVAAGERPPAGRSQATRGIGA